MKTVAKSSKVMILKNIKEAVLEMDPQAEVILFGSRARGDAREDSDWDVLVLVPSAVDYKVEQKFRHRLFDLELELEQAISTFVFSKYDWENKHRITPFYESVESEGIEL
ncbi:nucleotidyltransferase domain-containing protein [Persicitalea jodogahamensis]|uniref:DNA polymerase subunit beta n=1 Tax=Persicitalea jodogahamensis TaxID=402147 RepID=A0A8J3D9X1_9BACT|nr:nucleotidyltransferase domain-containing protein [Persicitalea jodogahamensis]GHB71938.1 DNA polymerase subunit beta [Persicitalea jodogahamensis]